MLPKYCETSKQKLAWEVFLIKTKYYLVVVKNVCNCLLSTSFIYLDKLNKIFKMYNLI